MRREHSDEECGLRCRAFFLAKIGEPLALIRKPLQKRGGPPDLTVLTMEFEDAVATLFEHDGVGVLHRTAAMGGESVAVEINYVDVRGAQRVAVLQNARTLVNQRIEATVCDFPCRYLTLHNARFVDPFANEFSHEGVRRLTALLAVFVPACAGFLAVPAEFTKAIFGKRLTNAGYFQVAIFFADAPADIEARDVAGGQGPHGHAEAGTGRVDGFGSRTFLDEDLGFS